MAKKKLSRHAHKRDARGRFVSKETHKAQTKLRQQARAESKAGPKTRKPRKYRKLYRADALGQQLPALGTESAKRRARAQRDILTERLLPSPDKTREIRDPKSLELPFTMSVTRYQGMGADELVTLHLQNLTIASALTGEQLRAHVVIHFVDSQGRIVSTYSTKWGTPLDVLTKHLPALMEVNYVKGLIDGEDDVDLDIVYDVVVTTQGSALDDYTRGLGTYSVEPVRPRRSKKRTVRTTKRKRSTSKKRATVGRGPKTRVNKRKQPKKVGKSRKVAPSKRRRKVNTRGKKPTRRSTRH